MMAYVVLFFAALLSASLASAQPRNGILEVRVKDDREAIGDFSQLDIVFEMISISPKFGPIFLADGLEGFETFRGQGRSYEISAPGRYLH